MSSGWLRVEAPALARVASVLVRVGDVLGVLGEDLRTPAGTVTVQVTASACAGIATGTLQTEATILAGRVTVLRLPPFAAEDEVGDDVHPSTRRERITPRTS